MRIQVHNEDCHGPANLSQPSGIQCDRSRNQIANSDALQHPGDPDCRPAELVSEDQSIWKSIEKQANREYRERSLECVHHQFVPVGPLLNTFRKGERHGDADNPEKERKDEIGEGPSIPCRMFEWRIDMRPGTGVIDHHHASDGGAPKYIQRKQAAAGLGSNRFCHRRLLELISL